ncbi:tetratricopeptide repeat protein [Nonomuraea sp. NPDC052129]|uniref:tetratricopeptide repeat protein n=1 Tax=Nonomuraea TaxID=83681 RepID=UPI001CD9CA35|nr:tetratricopeptide repeat protein [Nonomuraea aurantiaca]MCA2227127.1 tetratricopeptide repeat protein [Nonomuraea aurantiaca]
MAHVTREHLDRLLEQALLADDHGSLAKRLYDVALGYSTGDVSRASILVLAAEEWRAAGQPARAMECFQRAMEDGGESSIDPRAGIADTLFELDRPDEAREVIETIRAEGRATTATAHTIAETLVAYGDLRAGHEWATQAVLACDEDDPEHVALLRTRYRIRVDLGLPEDDLDALVS